MSIYRVKPDDFETFSVITHPVRTFSSSSVLGVTGSVFVYPNRSDVEKDTSVTSAFLDTTYNDISLATAEKSMQEMGRRIRNTTGGPEFKSQIEHYLSSVNTQSLSRRKRHALSIQRWIPPTRFTQYTNRKLIIKDVLNKYYRVYYPSAQWAYTNYHTLNFFTASNLPTGSALLYPNIAGGPIHDGYVTGTYIPSGAFSFDFYINPRYVSHVDNGTVPVGTIAHLSSTYALSLSPGTERDVKGRTCTFRLKLQLSHSADIKPSLAQPGAYPNDLVFISDDNVLKWNNWHRVVVRWGTNVLNEGTGTFNIDNVDRGIFIVPSATIAPQTMTSSGEPDVLVIGNYYEGTNTGTSAQALFFATNPALRDGLTRLVDDGGVREHPDNFKFAHPLNAELHDLSLKRHYMNDDEILSTHGVGVSSLDTSDVALYIPPFFTQTSPFRQYVGDHGGVFQTPFFEVDGSTDDPFNVALSFGVAGHDINLENFVKDFANNVNPRLHLLTGTTIDYTTQARTANEFLYDDPRVVKRNLTILPCDDGNFMPNFELLLQEVRRSQMINDLGSPDLSLIHLDNLISSSAALFGTSFEPSADDAAKLNEATERFVNEQVGFTPEQPGISAGPAYQKFISNLSRSIANDTYDPGIQRGAPLTVYNRTRDASSNQVAFFDISNLFYGDKIHPTSLSITDVSYTGSAGQLNITVKDDGFGNLYRADCLTPRATWNGVGNVYYDEGVAVIKSPHLYFFGKDAFSTTFRGTRSVHVLNIHTIADRGQLNSSSNPNWMLLSASTSVTDTEQFVYLTGMYFLDDNLNVVMKTQLAQPVTKRYDSRLAFRTKLDF